MKNLNRNNLSAFFMIIGNFFAFLLIFYTAFTTENEQGLYIIPVIVSNILHFVSSIKIK